MATPEELSYSPQFAPLMPDVEEFIIFFHEFKPDRWEIIFKEGHPPYRERGFIRKHVARFTDLMEHVGQIRTERTTSYDLKECGS